MEHNSKVLTLCLTESCNLNCVYCYEHNKQANNMSFSTAKKIIDEELNAEDGFDHVQIEYFGGEPFLAFEELKAIHEYLLSKRWKKSYRVNVTTNGTLVHGEIKQWLYDHRDTIVCSLSLDGNRIAHNINRCDSFDQIDISFFQKTWPNQSIKMTISALSLPYLAESVVFAHQKGFVVNCNLAYGIDWSEHANINELRKQLSTLINFYIENPNIEPCSMLSYNIGMVQKDNSKVRKWCGAGTHMPTYSVNGEKYACQFFLPLSLGEDKAKAAKHLTFIQDIPLLLLDQKCQVCPFVSICPSCCGSNYMDSGNLYKKDDNQCKLTKIIIQANSFFQYLRLSNDLLGISEDEKYRLLNGILITQEYFADTN